MLLLTPPRARWRLSAAEHARPAGVRLLCYLPRLGLPRVLSACWSPSSSASRRPWVARELADGCAGTGEPQLPRPRAGAPRAPSFSSCVRTNPAAPRFACCCSSSPSASFPLVIHLVVPIIFSLNMVCDGRTRCPHHAPAPRSPPTRRADAASARAATLRLRRTAVPAPALPCQARACAASAARLPCPPR